MADELFNELGYEKIDSDKLKHIRFIADIDATTRAFIQFHKTYHKIETYIYDSRDKECMNKVISMQELQAINKKCKELRLDIMKINNLKEKLYALVSTVISSINIIMSNIRRCFK